MFAVQLPPEPAGSNEREETETGSRCQPKQFEDANKRRIQGGDRKEEKEERSIKPGLPSKILVTTPKEQEIKIGTANTTPSVVG